MDSGPSSKLEGRTRVASPRNILHSTIPSQSQNLLSFVDIGKTQEGGLIWYTMLIVLEIYPSIKPLGKRTSVRNFFVTYSSIIAFIMIRILAPINMITLQLGSVKATHTLYKSAHLRVG